MLRVRAVQSLLLEEVAGIPAARGSGGFSPEEGVQALESAGRRALLVSLLLGVGVVMLLAARPAGEPFLVSDGVETIFSLGALLVAGYSGFRLAQWRQYRRMVRALGSLPEEEA
jgi:hypothetical protein